MGKRKYNKKTNQANKINAAFLAVLVLCIACGFTLTLIGHTDFLSYENRSASKLQLFSIEDFIAGNFQDNVESSFVDQTIGSNSIKHGFNVTKSYLISSAIEPLKKYEQDEQDTDDHEILVGETDDIGGSEIVPDVRKEVIVNPVTTPAVEPITQPAVEPITQPTVETQTAITPIQPVEPKELEKAESAGGKYYSVGGGLYKYGEYVVQGVVNLKGNQSRFDSFFNKYNDIIAEHPEINFYSYYIERDSDQNYATGKRAGIAEYIKSSINVSENHFGIQEVRDFETYKEYNYKSDHHWAYKGSYAGYTDILSMLKPDATPIEILGEYKIGTYKGSFTKTDATANICDDFYAYELAFPQMDVKFNNKAVNDYGLQSTYISKAKSGNEKQSPTYGSFYGNDVGFIDIYNPTGSGSLLIFGNSYDNAVVKPLASHYEHTYCIDLRYYKSSMGSAFSFGKFVEQFPVDDVITIGNAYYYLQGAFYIPK